MSVVSHISTNLLSLTLSLPREYSLGPTNKPLVSASARRPRIPRMRLLSNIHAGLHP